MYRSRKDKMLFGVLGGLANLIGLKNAGLLRVIFVVTLFITAGFPILIYFLMAIFIPYESNEYTEFEEVKKE